VRDDTDRLTAASDFPAFGWWSEAGRGSVYPPPLARDNEQRSTSLTRRPAGQNMHARFHASTDYSLPDVENLGRAYTPRSQASPSHHASAVVVSRDHATRAGADEALSIRVSLTKVVKLKNITRLVTTRSPKL
jgi:hypothetical protein